jgi:hypothetical protein
MDELLSFLSAIEEDPRISTAHISLYMALWKKWTDSGSHGPLSFFRCDVIASCKIAGGNTYHKVLRQLNEYGYIKYVPSYNRFQKNLVHFVQCGSY